MIKKYTLSCIPSFCLALAFKTHPVYADSEDLGLLGPDAVNQMIQSRNYTPDQEEKIRGLAKKIEHLSLNGPNTTEARDTIRNYQGNLETPKRTSFCSNA